ncbi:MAG: hypothetical protein ISS18_16530 [Bacteroidales bacterium]|nr:hypothetical protein [Bacteroidales bacterium]
MKGLPAAGRHNMIRSVSSTVCHLTNVRLSGKIKEVNSGNNSTNNAIKK